MINSGDPISGIQMKWNDDDDDDRFVIAIKTANKQIKCYAVQFSSQHGYKRCGHFYKTMCELQGNQSDTPVFNNKTDLSKKAQHYIVFVPNLEEDKQNDYTIISNEWLYLTEHMNLGFNTIQNNLFIKI